MKAVLSGGPHDGREIEVGSSCTTVHIPTRHGVSTQHWRQAMAREAEGLEPEPRRVHVYELQPSGQWIYTGDVAALDKM